MQLCNFIKVNRDFVPEFIRFPKTICIFIHYLYWKYLLPTTTISKCLPYIIH